LAEKATFKDFEKEKEISSGAIPRLHPRPPARRIQAGGLLAVPLYWGRGRWEMEGEKSSQNKRNHLCVQAIGINIKSSGILYLEEKK